MKPLAFIVLVLTVGASARVIDGPEPPANMNRLFNELHGDVSDPFNGEGTDPFDEGFTRDNIICETSEASPLWGHVMWIAHNLENEEDDNTCFNAMVGMGNQCGETLREWSAAPDGDFNGGAAFQLCRTDMSGASRNCKGGQPGPTDCEGRYACGGYPPEVIAWVVEALAWHCFQWSDKQDDFVTGGIFKVMGGELKVYRMPG